MAVKNLFKVLAMNKDRRSAKGEKEKLMEKHKLPKRNCAPVIVGSGGKDEKRYEVPIKYLPSIVAEPRDELDLEPDGPIRIDCPTEIFDAILKSLKN